MTRQTNMNEARLTEENERLKSKWETLRFWLDEVADGHISGNDVLRVMDTILKPLQGDEQ